MLAACDVGELPIVAPPPADPVRAVETVAPPSPPVTETVAPPSPPEVEAPSPPHKEASLTSKWADVIDAVNSTLPCFRSIIPGSAAADSACAATTCVCSTELNSAGVVSTAGFFR